MHFYNYGAISSWYTASGWSEWERICFLANSFTSGFGVCVIIIMCGRGEEDIVLIPWQGSLGRCVDHDTHLTLTWQQFSSPY